MGHNLTPRSMVYPLCLPSARFSMCDFRLFDCCSYDSLFEFEIPRSTHYWFPMPRATLLSTHDGFPMTKETLLPTHDWLPMPKKTLFNAWLTSNTKEDTAYQPMIDFQWRRRHWDTAINAWLTSDVNDMCRVFVMFAFCTFLLPPFPITSKLVSTAMRSALQLWNRLHHIQCKGV